jgi:hypothetical protein
MKHKKYHLIYFFSMLFFILSLVSTTSAQTSYLDSLDGKFALQFQITDNFQISSFQGSTLSGKYHLGIRSAIRLGLMVELNSSDTDDETILPDSLIGLHNEKDSKIINTTLNTQYIYFFALNHDIAAFGGIGPFFTYQSLNSKTHYPYDDITYEEKQTNYFTGLDFIFGVEWWFHKSMSLSAEYGFRLSYSSYNIETKSPSYEKKIDRIEYEISPKNVNLGISIYF